MDRQKILTIFGVAWLSAALLTWFLWSSTKAPKQEKTVKIVAASRDMPIGYRVGKDDVKMVTVLEREAPRTALTNPAQAIGRAVVYPVNSNEPVTASRLTGTTTAEGISAVIEPGKRAVSVPFTDQTGASGLIMPKSRVDVLFTRPGNTFEAMTVTVLEDVEVLSVGRVTQVDQQAPGTSTKASATTVGSSTTSRTATLVLTPEQAQKLELAKNQGKLSLALRNPTDRSTQTELKASTMEQIDPLLLVRSSSSRVRGRLPGNIGNRADWAALIGDEAPKPPPKPVEPPPKPEPPKPRAIVDVFRGEKHVQEIFQ